MRPDNQRVEQRTTPRPAMTIAGATVVVLVLLLCTAPAPTIGASQTLPPLSAQAAPTLAPTPDATVAALNREKLDQEIRQLRTQNDWSWTAPVGALSGPLAALGVTVGALFGIYRWFGDRRDERDKRDEERFQAVVASLGSDTERTRLGAAIGLRTFLQPGYERFYQQVFDLAVAHLRLPVEERAADQASARVPEQQGDQAPGQRAERVTERHLALRQPLITTFKEAFPLAYRVARQRQAGPFDSRALDASYIQLEGAFLWQAQLENVYMPWAHLRETDLTDACLKDAALWGGQQGGDHRGVKLKGANLEGANLGGSDLSDADLSGADLRSAKAWAKFNRADLRTADFREAQLCGPTYAAEFVEAELSDAKLGGADLRRVDFTAANLCGTDLSGADLREAKLRGAVMDESTTFAGAKLDGATYSTVYMEYWERDGGRLVRIPATKGPRRLLGLPGFVVKNEF